MFKRIFTIALLTAALGFTGWYTFDGPRPCPPGMICPTK